MSEWKTVSDKLSYGIVIYNFPGGEGSKLNLTVGNAVHLLEEDDYWYFGYLIGDYNKRGYIAKSFVHIKECESLDNSGCTPKFIFKEPAITLEITLALREWGAHCKQLYVNHSDKFDIIKNKIYDLMALRSMIISGTLPVDELKRVTKQASEEIDMGNKILDLDLVVRDAEGNLVHPIETSTIQLYYLHKRATERMHNRTKPEQKKLQPKTAIQQYSNIFIVSVKNFTCKMAEDVELLMTLYDAKEFKPITEYYVVRWTKEGLMSDLDKMYSLRVMFTDLGKRDLERERIFLICNVVRIGAMDTKETDHRRSSAISMMNSKRNSSENMRRPCGVAAMDITSYFNGTTEGDLERHISIPFVTCDKDNLEQTLKKVVSKERVERGSSLFVSMKLLRGDLKQLREEHPHLVVGNISRARKMGFPEVILPGDVRNDLYLTLICGEFSKGSKTSEKNVEVVVKVCNDKGSTIPGVISLGGEADPIDEYRSVIYYHEDKPQWHETMKVAISIDEFKTSHIKFTFKHRSSNEAKDKSEKPFAMCYVKLMQENGTTLPDARHNLVVYKIDWKKFDETSLEYLKLPSVFTEIKDNQKPQITGLSMSSKDSFILSSNICSTKLTQNVDLLGLLNWASHKNTLKDSLESLMKVDGEEVVKFLQDILDALFNILMEYVETDTYDILVFECLLHIISLVSNDWKYQHFEPVLDMYIKESFSATLAYKKLISVLNSIISRAKDSLLFKTMKSLQYVMRFVSKSRKLYNDIYSEIDATDDFELSLRNLLQNIINMMSSTTDSLLREQGACLKYLPSTIPDILLVFNAKDLSLILCDLLQKIPMGRLTKQKMMTINEIVHSELFKSEECRRILMPLITRKIKHLLETKEEVELCIKILSDIMESLFHKEAAKKSFDIDNIIHTNLRTIMQSHIKMERDNPHSGNLVAVMIDIFRQMSEEHYNNYINTFQTSYDVLDFIMEILVVFKELVNKSVFAQDWCDMIMVQNKVILKSLRYFSTTIRDRFFKKFEYDAWNNFFHCAIAFMTQPTLQLETFSANKRNRIVNQYEDMRRQMGFEIKSMWFNLGTNKVQFVPALVGLILEMTLIPESELRKATIPIFFDMMQCEYYSSRLEADGYGDTKRDSSHIKGSFRNFEDEMIAKMDTLLEGGRGDDEFKDLFYEIMIENCSKHTNIRDEGTKFVKILTKLMEHLLEYRDYIQDENMENRMSCTVNLLDFYSEIKKEEMYIRYVMKLYELHLECDNYTEAAYTLGLYTNLLKWSNDILTPLLRTDKFNDARTHRQLKDKLYYTIIDNFNEGKMWECAIIKCQELAEQYKDETFEYDKLSQLHTSISKFYSLIIQTQRNKHEYFRVGYYGKGFPQFLQNKVFIYRGAAYEKLSDINSRILNLFSKAELLKTLTPPGPEIMASNKQYIQINKVDPVMDEKNQRFSGKPVSDEIVSFYRVNNIQKFTFSRPFPRKDENLNCNNEFANLWLERTELITSYPLPGILRYFPVKFSSAHEISPLRNAIEVIESKNKTLKMHITMYNKNGTVDQKPLCLVLNGILDAAVMGGIKNYEEAFFDSNYEECHPDDLILLRKLKDLIADQIPLLDLCVQIHKFNLPINVQPLQKRFEECFNDLKREVERKYGIGTCDVKLENEVQMRRHYSISNEDRLTELAIVDNNVGGRSRVTSLTRNQVASLRQFTSTFTFAASTPILNSKNHHNHSHKNLIQSPTKSFTGTPSLSHKKSHKTPKEKRRSSKADITNLPLNSLASTGATQWYTSTENETSTTSASNNSLSSSTATTPIFELTQELTPKRPLRSEVEKEKRLSRPSSGQFSRPNSMTVSIRGTGSSGNSSNRDSVGTTDSSVSEEDIVPPPLPMKTRENDTNSITSENISFLYSNRSSVSKATSLHLNSLPVIESVEWNNETPPPPPPKLLNLTVII